MPVPGAATQKPEPGNPNYLLSGPARPALAARSLDMHAVMNPRVNPAQTWPSTPEERTYAVWTHLTLILSLIGHAVGIVVTLVLWLTRRERSALIDDHGKEVLNGQITFLIYWFACLILSFVGIGLVLFGVLYLGTLVALIRGANAAQRGELYRYPMCLRFVR